MRWVLLAILIYLLSLVHTSLGGLLTFTVPSLGNVSPDLLAILAVLLAMHAVSAADAMLAAWLMGLVIDLTTGAGAEASTAVGVMSLTYALAAGVIYRLREIVFRDSVMAQCLMVVVFCILAHWLWVTVQWIIALRFMMWSGYGVMLFQATALAFYSAVLTGLLSWPLRRCIRWIIVIPPGRQRWPRRR